MIDVILAVGAVSAAVGIIQYGVLHYDSLRLRPEGALSHYMTYSGTLMLVLCAAVARLVFGTRDRTWPALVMPALVVALAVSLGRNAWVGACVAVGLLLALRDFRLTALLPVVIALVFALAPDSVTNRMMSMFDLHDPSNQDRIAMLEVGAGMVRDHPLTGVGPTMVQRVYEQYRPDYAVQRGQSAPAQRAGADCRGARNPGAADLGLVHRHGRPVARPDVPQRRASGSLPRRRSPQPPRCWPPGSSSTTLATPSS